MTKKEIAESFLKLVSSGNVREAYGRFVHSDFRHHNAYFKGDRESLLVAMEEAATASPNKSLEVVREGGKILRGKAKPSRKFIVEAPDVKKIRSNYKLSQAVVKVRPGAT